MRCFIAIELSEEIKFILLKLQDKIKDFDVKLVEKENIHITLKFLGDIDDIYYIKNKLKNIFNCMKPLDIRLVGIGVFPNTNHINVIWVGVDGLLRLQNNINKALSDKFPIEKPVTHITIARVKSSAYKNYILSFVKKNEGCEYGNMKVSCIKLKQSVLTQRNPVYTDIEAFEL